MTMQVASLTSVEMSPKQLKCAVVIGMSVAVVMAQIIGKSRNVSINVEVVRVVHQHGCDVLPLPIHKIENYLNEKNSTDIVLPGQVLMQNNGVLQVTCARKFYCEPSSCQPLVIPGTRQGPSIHTLQQQLFQTSNNNSSSNSTQAKFLKIQFWGDSIQEQMECDFRQWYLDSTNNEEEFLLSQGKRQRGLHVEYVQIGCPWICARAEIEHENVLKQKASQADVIVVNLGAHYEWEHAIKLDLHLLFLEEIFEATIAKKGGLVIVRSPSATHFKTSNGLCNSMSVQALEMQHAATNHEKRCGPVSSMPAVIADQVESLKNMTYRLGSTAVYLDVYKISQQRHEEHAFLHGNKPAFDCKHFCQSCGVYRAWNVLAATHIINWASIC